MIPRHTMLFKRSAFFVDVFNVICHIDLFLYHEIRHQILSDPNGMIADIFSDRFPLNVWEKESDDIKIIHLASRKNNQNILLDWVSVDKLQKYNEDVQVDGKTVELTGDEFVDMFLSTLYVQCISEPTCNELLQFTEFGNALKLLMKDSNLDKVTFHIPFESELVVQALLREYAGPNNKKLFINVGDIITTVGSDFANANSFVFENVRDVDKYLRTQRKHGIEVLIPNYEYNMVEDRGTLEKTMEQVMIQRMNLEEPLPDYMEKYNISVNSISVPI